MSSNFTKFSSVSLPTLNNPLYKLTEDLVYERYFKGSKVYITVPKGFETDFASLPWIITLFFKKDDARWINASIIHDYLWSNIISLSDYQQANEIFREAMIVGKTPEWIADMFFFAVSLSKYFYFIKNRI